MAYLPKNKYQQKYTNGGEFIVASTGRPYIGDYLELFNKTYYAGKTPQNISIELKPIVKSSQNIPSTISNRKFEILNPKYVSKERNYIPPVATKVFPTQEDYNRGRFTRYFVYRIIKKDYIEVDKKTYEDTRSGKIIDSSLYVSGRLLWQLKSDIETSNLNQLLITEQSFPGISILFPNLKEFAFQG